MVKLHKAGWQNLSAPAAYHSTIGGLRLYEYLKHLRARELKAIHGEVGVALAPTDSNSIVGQPNIVNPKAPPARPRPPGAEPKWSDILHDVPT